MWPSAVSSHVFCSLQFRFSAFCIFLFVCAHPDLRFCMASVTRKGGGKETRKQAKARQGKGRDPIGKGRDAGERKRQGRDGDGDGDRKDGRMEGWKEEGAMTANFGFRTF